MSSPATSRRRYLQKRDEILEQAKSYRMANPTRRWEMHLKYKYGITAEQYTRLFNFQEGRCRICRNSAENEKRKLAVDHDHITGRIRGLLCARCNNGLGYFRDNIITMKAAIAYLEEDRYESLSASCIRNSYQ